MTRTDFINKKVYPKEGTRVRIPGRDALHTYEYVQYEVVSGACYELNEYEE